LHNIIFNVSHLPSDDQYKALVFATSYRYVQKVMIAGVMYKL